MFSADGYKIDQMNLQHVLIKLVSLLYIDMESWIYKLSMFQTFVTVSIFKWV